MNLKRTLIEAPASPKEPTTRKWDDAATSGEGELRESGMSSERDSKKDGGAGSLDSKRDPSKSMGSEHASVVGKASEKETEHVVVTYPGGGDVTEL